MWYKWLAIAAVIVAAFFLFSAPDDEALPGEKTEPLRSAKGVVMIEKRPGDFFRIVAVNLQETEGGKAVLDDFNMVREDGTRIRGKRAEYDMEKMILVVPGEVFVDDDEGLSARLDGLVLDRKTNTGKTENPVRLKMSGLEIDARGAEFLDDFETIRFVGGVHAKIHPDYISD